MSNEKAVRFARWVFLLAGIIGLVELVPLYFMEQLIGIKQPPPITHPGFYYGFLGVAVAWQIAFLIISRDPVRYQPLMPALFLEKLLYPAGVFTLFLTGRAPAQNLQTAVLDLIWLALFITVWVKLRR
jgi:hypothetical protein